MLAHRGRSLGMRWASCLILRALMSRAKYYITMAGHRSIIGRALSICGYLEAHGKRFAFPKAHTSGDYLVDVGVAAERPRWATLISIRMNAVWLEDGAILPRRDDEADPAKILASSRGEWMFSIRKNPLWHGPDEAAMKTSRPRV